MKRAICRTAICSALITFSLAATLSHAEPAGTGSPAGAPTTAAPSIEQARAVRASVEAVMRRIEAAVVSADAKAFMQLMDATDPEFFTEQANLAKDWARVKPERFTWTILDAAPTPAPTPAQTPSTTDKPAPAPASAGAAAPAAEPARARPDPEMAGQFVAPVFGPDRAVCTVEMTWQMQGWTKPRTLRMPVAFTRATGSEGDRWLYAGEDWESITVPALGAFHGVRILFERGNERHREVAQDIAKGMPEIRAMVDEHFQCVPQGPVTIKLYQSMRHLQASIWLSYTDGLSGWNEPKESMKLLVRTRYEQMKKTLAHEYGHCVTFHMGEKATDAPWWVLEGAADFAAAPLRANAAKLRDTAVRNWARSGDLAPWDAIEKFPIPDEFKKFTRNVYTQGEHMMAFIDARHGPDGRNAFLRELFKGKSTAQASRDALGEEWADIDRAWRQSIDHALSTEPRDDK